MSFGQRSLLAVAAILAIAVIAPAAHSSTPEAKAISTMQQDLAARSPDINWLSGFNPETADLFAHNELLIHASCAKVFGRIADVKDWPKWYPNASGIRIVDDGPTLRLGTRFRWTTFGLHIESKVNEFAPASRVGWYGYAPGQPPAFYHIWHLTSAPGGCMTVMEEVGKGAASAHLRAMDEGLMHRGHDLWLQTLRWMSESQGD